VREIILEFFKLLYKLLDEIFKPRTIFTGIFFFSFCYLTLKQLPVPEILNTIVSTLLGYWYGSKKAKESA